MVQATKLAELMVLIFTTALEGKLDVLMVSAFTAHLAAKLAVSMAKDFTVALAHQWGESMENVSMTPQVGKLAEQTAYAECR